MGCLPRAGPSSSSSSPAPRRLTSLFRPFSSSASSSAQSRARNPARVTPGGGAQANKTRPQEGPHGVATKPTLETDSPLTTTSSATAAPDKLAMSPTSMVTPQAQRVHRVTMFKLQGKENQDKLLGAYGKLAAAQARNGKPYILSMLVGPTEDDSRRQGWTFVCKTEFASMDDMAYYDDGCTAHNDLRIFVKTLPVDDVMTIFFTAQVAGGTAL